MANDEQFQQAKEATDDLLNFYKEYEKPSNRRRRAIYHPVRAWLLLFLAKSFVWVLNFLLFCHRRELAGRGYRADTRFFLGRWRVSDRQIRVPPEYVFDFGVLEIHDSGTIQDAYELRHEHFTPYECIRFYRGMFKRYATLQSAHNWIEWLRSRRPRGTRY